MIMKRIFIIGGNVNRYIDFHIEIHSECTPNRTYIDSFILNATRKCIGAKAKGEGLMQASFLSRSIDDPVIWTAFSVLEKKR